MEVLQQIVISGKTGGVCGNVTKPAALMPTQEALISSVDDTPVPDPMQGIDSIYSSIRRLMR